MMFQIHFEKYVIPERRALVCSLQNFRLINTTRRLISPVKDTLGLLVVTRPIPRVFTT